MLLYIILGIVFVIIIIGVIVAINYLKLKDLSETIKICEGKINESLNEKKELLNQICKDCKNKELSKISNIEDNLNLFEFDNTLYNIKNKINMLINDKKYKPKKEILEVIKNLNDVDDNIEGLIDYYNSKVSVYNNRYEVKPFNYIYAILKLKNIETFKIKKVVDYEILKD